MSRVRWIVSPIKGVFGWKVTRNSFDQRTFLFQYRAIDFAVEQANYELEEYGIRSELQIQGRNGRWRDPRTYGDDPPEILG